MGHTLRCELLNPQEQYTLHDIIAGSVHADFTKPIDVQNVAFKVKCLVWVDITHSGNHHDSATDKVFFCDQQIFPPADLANAVSSNSLTLPAGHYEWPFSIDLSQFSGMVVPPTSQGRNGSSCCYKVTFTYKAVVHRDSRWKTNIRNVNEAKLLPCVDAEYLELAPIQSMVSEMEYKIRDLSTQKTSFFSRTPRMPNKIFATLDVPVIIPQAPRLMGIRLKLEAEKEVQVDSIQVILYEQVIAHAVFHRGSVYKTFLCGEFTPLVVGTDLDLTQYVSDCILSQALPSYEVKLLNCCHRLELIIKLSDPNSTTRKAKMKVCTPVTVASPNVHRHNAPLYESVVNEGKKLEKTNIKVDAKSNH